MHLHFIERGLLMSSIQSVILPTLSVLIIGLHDTKAEDGPLKAVLDQYRPQQFQLEIDEVSKQIEKDAESVRLYSRRGDLYFFQGNFKKSVSDYEKMVELDPRQDTSHWRRGIARFYDGKFKDAAHQFEIYNTFDDVDRENGIWRYFSQHRAHGPKKAKQGLLKYKKDDREPFPSVYRLFSGELKPEPILESIKAADIDDDERNKRLFYAQLYIGLNHALEGRDAVALIHLKASTLNPWGPKAGYGPHYMWQVGRLHFEILSRRQKQQEKKQKSASEKAGKQPND